MRSPLFRKQGANACLSAFPVNPFQKRTVTTRLPPGRHPVKEEVSSADAIRSSISDVLERVCIKRPLEPSLMR
jgi:hypothetical protein